jgi:hypothetical protein
MKKIKIVLLLLLSSLFIAGCEVYNSNELVVEKFIEKEEYYKKGKLYTENIYMIKTDKRVYKVDDHDLDYSSSIYYSYNVGDKVSFSGKNSYLIIKNYRKNN